MEKLFGPRVVHGKVILNYSDYITFDAQQLLYTRTMGFGYNKSLDHTCGAASKTQNCLLRFSSS